MTRPMATHTEYLYGLPKMLMGAAVAPPSIPAVYRFNAVVIDHHDGDTFWARIPLFPPFNLAIEKIKVRIIGVAARETARPGQRAQPGGNQAAAALAARNGMTVGSPVVLTAAKLDAYPGRIDAVVSYLVDGVPRDLASDLIADQWAAPWNGRGEQPKPPWPRTVT